MPSRAYTSFLQKLEKISTMRQTSVSMPSRAYTSFLHRLSLVKLHLLTGVNALSGLYLISTVQCLHSTIAIIYIVSMPSRAYTSFLLSECCYGTRGNDPVSMPSRAYTSFLRLSVQIELIIVFNLCQCPLGLIPHFYGTPSKT